MEKAAVGVVVEARRRRYPLLVALTVVAALAFGLTGLCRQPSRAKASGHATNARAASRDSSRDAADAGTEGPSARSSRRDSDPTSPELPNKFERSKFRVPNAATPLAPTVTNAAPAPLAPTDDGQPEASPPPTQQGTAGPAGSAGDEADAKEGTSESPGRGSAE